MLEMGIFAKDSCTLFVDSCRDDAKVQRLV